MGRKSVLLQEIRLAAACGYPYYVYELADEAGVFYVGKGKGQRLWMHGKGSDSCNSKKLARIIAAAQVTRTVVAYFQCEADAYAHEATRIQEARASLTNAAPGVSDPRAAASNKAASMLARIVPRDRYRAPAWLGLTRQQALESYDRLVAEIRRQVEDPAPTSYESDRAGRVIRVGYNEVHA